MTVLFPDRLPLAQLPTPIYPLDRFTAVIGSSARLWVKRDDLTGCTTSGNKIRKLEFTLAEAKAKGADVIITCGGVQSNHARATAILGAQLGFRVHLLLRGEECELTGKGNHFLDLLAGAEIDCYSSSIYVTEFESILKNVTQSYLDKGLTSFFIPTGASDATGVWGYVNASKELKTQIQFENIAFDDIVCACGSGGTLAGLVAGNEIYQLGANIWGINVCDNAAYFEKKSRDDLLQWKDKFSIDLDINALSVSVIDGYVGPGYAKAEEPVYQLIKQLAGLEGLILDPIYTGKAFYGLVQELHKGRFEKSKNILFIHTGGLFGLMADPAIGSYI